MVDTFFSIFLKTDFCFCFFIQTTTINRGNEGKLLKSLDLFKTRHCMSNIIHGKKNGQTKQKSLTPWQFHKDNISLINIALNF